MVQVKSDRDCTNWDENKMWENCDGDLALEIEKFKLQDSLILREFV